MHQTVVIEKSGEFIEVIVGNISIVVKRTDEGAHAEIQNELGEEISTAYASFSEAMTEDE